MYLKLASLFICIAYITIRTAHAYEDDEKLQHAVRLLEQMTETRKGLSALKQVLNGIDQDLQDAQKRNCLVGGGLSRHCAVAFLDSQLTLQDWLKSGLSPGRRMLAATPDLSASASADTERKVQDLTTKRKGLEILKKILEEMDADIGHEQKRTCQVNLGGHCATESAASVADQWHYLNSPLSPGRKRRDTTLYRKLVSGKLFH